MPRPNKVIKSSVDTGTPPRGVLEAARQKQLLLDDAEEEYSPAETPPSVGEATHLEKVKLEHALYELTFRALDVSISKHQVAIKVPNSSAFQFEPKVDSLFQITFRGKTYNAVYLGGIFTFASDSSWAITFILNKEPVVNDINERIQE